MDLVTDEDESEAESEEDFELNEKEQRFLHQAYDNFGDYGLPWLQQRGHLPTDSRTPFEDADSVRERFEHLINLPDSWPLMRIMVPLDGLSLQLERIIACVAAELVATHQHPSGQTKFVKRVAKKLTAILACYLAGEVASMLSPVAAIEHREMVAPLYQPLLTPVFWVRPIYTELLHAASRLKKGTRIETARPSNGLVKIMYSPKALGEEPLNATAANRGRRPLDWLGKSCASSICVGLCPLGTLRLLCCEGTRANNLMLVVTTSNKPYAHGSTSPHSNHSRILPTGSGPPPRHPGYSFTSGLATSPMVGAPGGRLCQLYERSLPRSVEWGH